MRAVLLYNAKRHRTPRKRCQLTRLNRFLPQERMRTYCRGRRCINASWPTWPQAVWSLSESPLTEPGAAVCLYGALPVWDIELCGYEGQKVWLLLALSSRLWHVGYSICVCVCVLAGVLTLPLSVCVRECKTVWLNLSPFCLGWLLSWELRHLHTNCLSEAPQAKLRP